MLPQRPSGGYPAAQGPKSGVISSGVAQSFEQIKVKVLAKLEDRMDPSTSKRMPVSLLRQSLRTYAEQIADQEGRGLPKPDRERLVDEVLAELLGYGPLEELFNDPSVREVMVCGPHAVIVRRDMGGWIPCHVRFRDEDHLNAALDRLATHADPIGGATTSVNTFDLKLPNGFRAMAIVPPPALGVAANIAFIRVEAAGTAAAPAAPAASPHPVRPRINRERPQLPLRDRQRICRERLRRLLREWLELAVRVRPHPEFGRLPILPRRRRERAATPSPPHRHARRSLRRTP
ncbi:MAG: hypothetical protein K8U57_23855 [Planctomycetes bacterium]|nr:hypothetical protein [Planctomycetota bacterium]